MFGMACSFGNTLAMKCSNAWRINENSSMLAGHDIQWIAINCVLNGKVGKQRIIECNK